MADPHALAEFLKTNLEKVPAPKGYEAYREKLKRLQQNRPSQQIEAAEEPSSSQSSESA